MQHSRATARRGAPPTPKAAFPLLSCDPQRGSEPVIERCQKSRGAARNPEMLSFPWSCKMRLFDAFSSIQTAGGASFDFSPMRSVYGVGWDAGAPPKWFFFGLFFVKREPDVECLHPVPLAQLVQPRGWRRGSSLPGNQPQNPSGGSLSASAPSPGRFSGLCKGALRSHEQHLSRAPWGIRAGRAEWQTSCGRRG